MRNPPMFPMRRSLLSVPHEPANFANIWLTLIMPKTKLVRNIHLAVLPCHGRRKGTHDNHGHGEVTEERVQRIREWTGGYFQPSLTARTYVNRTHVNGIRLVPWAPRRWHTPKPRPPHESTHQWRKKKWRDRVEQAKGDLIARHHMKVFVATFGATLKEAPIVTDRKHDDRNVNKKKTRLSKLLIPALKAADYPGLLNRDMEAFTLGSKMNGTSRRRRHLLLLLTDGRDRAWDGGFNFNDIPGWEDIPETREDMWVRIKGENQARSRSNQARRHDARRDNAIAAAAEVDYATGLAHKHSIPWVPWHSIIPLPWEDKNEGDGERLKLFGNENLF